MIVVPGDAERAAGLDPHPRTMGVGGRVGRDKPMKVETTSSQGPNDHGTAKTNRMPMELIAPCLPSASRQSHPTADRDRHSEAEFDAAGQ